jgi:hypothetical protein
LSSEAAFGGDAVKRSADLDWPDTALFRRQRRRVDQPPANDFVVAITPSSHTGVSGTGKTTLATTLAKSFDVSESGFDAEKKATLDAGKLAYEVVPSVEPGSAVIFDEAQGAPGTDSVNSRRGMKSESLDAINGILANRDKRLTLILVGQQLAMLDKNLFPMIDAWLLIRKEPSDPTGPLVTHHKLYIEDYDLRSPDIKTPGVEDLRWGPLPADDPDYSAMEKKKQRAKQRRSASDNEEADDPTALPDDISQWPKSKRDLALKMAYESGASQSELADRVDLQQATISRIVNGQA